MSDALDTPLLPGHRLDRYELLCPLASGGMASVWVGRLQGKHGFEKLVAIKTILPQYAADARFRNMFLDEARILSQIQHVNVAQILDMGEERGVLYLVIEFVDGDSVSKLLRAIEMNRFPVPVGVILRVLADTCLGLHAAHELRDKKGGALVGLVHRDVSPQNVLITQEGATKLIDFGIAKVKGRLAQDTNAGGIKGKILFMAPEQAAGKPVDRRADIWAIGAILHSVYAQRTPFEGETEIDTLHALVKGHDPSPLGPEVPRAIRDIVSKATRFAPDARHQNALELSRALEAAMMELKVLTSQSDIAVFMSMHLKDRSAARQKALEFALHVAAQRERMRQAISPDPEDTSSGDGLVAMNARLMRASLDSAAPPPLVPQERSSARVRVAGTLAYEEGSLGNARTAFNANPPPAPSSPSLPSDSSSSLISGSALMTDPGDVAPPEDAPRAKAAALAVPELEIRADKGKPPPVAVKAPPPRIPAPEHETEPVFTPPPLRVASAAGSIVGPDVMGPDAGTAPASDAYPRDEFLDPAAIAAKRAEATARPAVPLTNDAPRPNARSVTPPGPTRAFVVDTQAELRKARERPPSRSKLRYGIGGVAVLLALAGTSVVLAPGCARRSAIAAAEQQGVVLGIERATVGWSTVHFYGVTASSLDFPNIKMSAPEATIELKTFEPDTIVVQDPALTMEGSADVLDSAFVRLRSRASAGTGKARRLAFQNARVTWNGPLGEGSRLDAEAVGLDLVRGATGLGDEAHLTSPSTKLLTARGLLGPWRVDGEHQPRSERLRIGFDPVIADGPSAIFVRAEHGTTAIVSIPRQPLTRLGIPYAFLGLAPDEQTQLEVQVQLTRPLPNRVAGDATLTLFDARLSPQAPRLDVVLKGQFAGEPGRPLDITRTQLSFGPLTARVLGAVTLLDESFRVDLKWNVSPIPCGVLLKKASPKEASASGLIAFDSRRPDQAEFTLTQASTCGLAIFPSP